MATPRPVRRAAAGALRAASASASAAGGHAERHSEYPNPGRPPAPECTQSNPSPSPFRLVAAKVCRSMKGEGDRATVRPRYRELDSDEFARDMMDYLLVASEPPV
eukprot:scaffold8021_cov119-Isochrysis_galbana.AAC.2